MNCCVLQLAGCSGAFVLYSSPHFWAFDSLNAPGPWEFAIHKKKKRQIPRAQPTLPST